MPKTKALWIQVTASNGLTNWSHLALRNPASKSHLIFTTRQIFELSTCFPFHRLLLEWMSNPGCRSCNLFYNPPLLKQPHICELKFNIIKFVFSGYQHFPLIIKPTGWLKTKRKWCTFVSMLARGTLLGVNTFRLCCCLFLWCRCALGVQCKYCSAIVSVLSETSTAFFVAFVFL